MTQSHHEGCSHGAQSSGSTLQTLDEVEFERGIWAAARDGEGDRVMELLGRGTHPSAQDTSGYTALHYAARAGHQDIVQVRKYENEFKVLNYQQKNGRAFVVKLWSLEPFKPVVKSI